MGGKHDIYIIEAAGEYRVRPAVAMVDGANKLKIRNLTEYTAVLVFPPGFLAGAQETVTLASKAKEEKALAQGLDKHYPYSVVIIKDGVLVPAKGESAPSVIVDP